MYSYLKSTWSIIIISLLLGECNGTRKSEKIKNPQSKYINVLSGKQAVMNWTWCMALNSTVTGVVIYKLSEKESQQLNFILSMDLSKNVHYRKNNSRHKLSSFGSNTSFQEKTVFVINDVNEADGGKYSLHIRRVGEVDLHSEVTLFVQVSGG